MNVVFMSVEVMLKFVPKKGKELQENENYKTFDAWCQERSKNAKDMDVSSLYQAIQQWIQSISQEPKNQAQAPKTKKPKRERKNKEQEQNEQEEKKQEEKEQEQKSKHPFGHICEPTDEKSALCCLKDQRNYLFHRRTPEIREDDCRQKVMLLSKQCYEQLLGDVPETAAEFQSKVDYYTTCKSLVILK